MGGNSPAAAGGVNSSHFPCSKGMTAFDDTGGLDEADELDESRSSLAKEASLLLAEAEALQEELAEAAQKAAEDALVLFRELGDRSSAAEALRQLILALRNQGKFHQAEARAFRELERSQELEDFEGECAMLLSLAELGQDLDVGAGKTASSFDALSAGRAALTLAQVLSDEKLQASALLAIAMLLQNAPDGTEEMMRCSNSALSLFRLQKDRAGETKALLALSEAFIIFDRPKDALKHVKLALEIAQSLQQKKLRAEGQLRMALLMELTCDYTQMLAVAEGALLTFRQAKWELGEICAMRLITRAHQGLDQPESGVEHLEEAIADFCSRGSKSSEASALELLAQLRFEEQKAEEALAAGERGLALAVELKDRQRESGFLHLMSRAQLSRKAYAEAMKMAEQAIVLMQENDDITGEAAVRLDTLVGVYAASGGHKDALSEIGKAVEIFQESGDLKAEGQAYLLAATECKSVGDMESAVHWMREARCIFEELGDTRSLCTALLSLAKARNHMDDPDEASRLGYEAYALARRLKDKITESSVLLFLVEAHVAQILKLVQAGRARDDPIVEEQMARADKAAFAVSKIAEKEDALELTANAVYTRAELYLVRGRLKEAIAGAEESIELFRQLGHLIGEGTSWVLLSQSLQLSGKIPEAVTAAEAGKDLSKKAQDKQLQQLADDLLDSIRDGPARGPSQQMPQHGQTPTAEAHVADVPQAAEKAAAGPVRLNEDTVSESLHGIMLEMVGDAVDIDMPFMDAGMDSLMSIEFRSRVTSTFEGLKLSSTLVFDYPTLRELTKHVVEASENQ